MPTAEPDPLAVLRALERHGVRYVLIGAAAARIAGAPVVTEDLDVTPATDRENLERLAAALRELGARLRSSAEPEGAAFPVDARDVDDGRDVDIDDAGGRSGRPLH